MERHFEWPYEVDLRCAPLGPRKKKAHSEWKVTLGPCFVLDSRAPASQPLISKNESEKKIMPNGPAQRSALLASRALF